MGFDDFKPFDNGCDQFGCNIWKNFSRKTPPFRFPTSNTLPASSSTTTESSNLPETTTIENVISTITNLFSDVPTSFNENTEVNASVSTTERSDIFNATFTDILKLEPSNSTLSINESTTSIIDVISSVPEVTSASSFTNVVQNSTLLPEITQNGTIVISGSDGNNSVLSTVTEAISSTVQNTMSDIITTTQEVVTSFNSTGNISTSTLKSIETDNSHFMGHHMHDDENHYWLYVILGIIVGILALIGIILLLIYIRYRKLSSHYFHNYYDVSPMKDVSNNSEQQKENACDKDVFVQFPC